MKENINEKNNASQGKIEQCFVIMPISDQGDYPKGHFTKVYEQIFKPAIMEAGYDPYRVDEDKISNPIINKIFQAVQECPMALCDLSNRNPNVLYELGLRQTYDKPVVLVQDDKTQRIFDVSGINTVQYSSERLYENVIEARKKITEAILSTKEGKENSIVKIVKAEVASMNVKEFSQEDRMEVMMNSLMSDIKELKNIARGSSVERSAKSNEKWRTSNEIVGKMDDSINNISGYMYKAEVRLKKEVTPEDISCVMRKIQDIPAKVSWIRNGRLMEVDILLEFYSFGNEKNKIIEILEELGDVSPRW